MKTLLEVLHTRLHEVLAIGERKPIAHVRIKGYRHEDRDPEDLFSAHVEDIGTDFIQVQGRMIDRKEIIEIEPVNF